MTKKLKGRGVEEAVLLPTPKLITAILQKQGPDLRYLR